MAPIVLPKEEEPPPKVEVKEYVPDDGTVEWTYWRSQFEGHLPAPIDVSISGATVVQCSDLKWYNFDVYPHKVKMTNTGYTVLVGAKWKTERPYLEGGLFLDKYVIAQIHFHWGPDMMSGSHHTVDKRSYPGEMQVVFYRAEYITQAEALLHPDGVVMVCYMIKHGVKDDDRLSWIIEGFPRIQQPQTNTRIGPYPMSRLLPMFYEDYLMYWGELKSVHDTSYVVRWIIPRTTLFASLNQMNQFRKLWDPWDEPRMGNVQPLHEQGDRLVYFFRPHWNQYNTTLPIPRILPEVSISELSPEYQSKLWMLPPQNAYMIPKPPEEEEDEKPREDSKEE